MPTASATDCATALMAARRAVVFTGAGVSTASGIPDFRGPDGLWRQVDPEVEGHVRTFTRDPARSWRFYGERLAALSDVQPNPAHRAIAALQAAGVIAGVITQNVDGLHQAAGGTDVIELHGSLRRAACVRCGAVVAMVDALAQLETRSVPTCPCGGHLKPGVIMFGDTLDDAPWQQAAALLDGCDAMLVVGSSLQVTPAANLPRDTRRRGAWLGIINQTRTRLDHKAHWRSFNPCEVKLVDVLAVCDSAARAGP